MYLNKITLSLLAIFICSRGVFADDDTYFSIELKQCTGDTTLFKIDSVSMSCEDGPCSWGSSATVSGSYTLGDEIATQTPTVSAYTLGFNFFNDTVDICDGGSVSNSDGDKCPSAGTYDYIIETELPGYSWLDSWMSWFSISISTTFDFGNAEVTCKVKVKSTQSNNSYSTMLIGSVAVGSALIILRMKRRRNVATRSELENEPKPDHEPSTHFVEMTTKNEPIVTGGTLV